MEDVAQMHWMIAPRAVFLDGLDDVVDSLKAAHN